MIAGAESTIAGAELSIGGAEGPPKSIQIDTYDECLHVLSFQRFQHFLLTFCFYSLFHTFAFTSQGLGFNKSVRTSSGTVATPTGCEATRLHLSTDPMPGGPVTSDLQLICLHPPELCAWTAHARVRGRVTLAVPLPVCKEGIYWPTHLSTCGPRCPHYQ